MQSLALSELPPPPEGKIGWPWTEESVPVPAIRSDGQPWPLISIVTPSYNQGQFIEETIRSVLLQGYPNLEYLVLDGGSTDQTREILEKYRPFLSYLRSAPDKGQSAAISEGFQRSSGEILAWLNSDDRYQPNAFVRVAEFFLAHPKIVFANSDVNFIDGAGNHLHRMYVANPNPLVVAHTGSHTWPQQGCFWRHSAYTAVGGVNESLRFCMDRDLFIRLARSGNTRRIPGKPLADFRIHETAKSSTIQEVANREGAMLIEKYSYSRNQNYIRLIKLYEKFWTKPAQLRQFVGKISHQEW